jgi:hypothetical protein
MNLTKCDKLLLWLSGKKTTIGLVCGLIISYLLGEGYIEPSLAYAIGGVLTALGATTNIATPKVYKKLEQ